MNVDIEGRNNKGSNSIYVHVYKYMYTYCHKMGHSVSQVGFTCSLGSIEHHALIVLQLSITEKRSYTLYDCLQSFQRLSTILILFLNFNSQNIHVLVIYEIKCLVYFNDI